MIKVKSADFLGGSRTLAKAPKGPPLPEVALLGRSNSGKSTLLNRLTGRRKLAKTSNTPGRTKELNFFSIELVQPPSTKVTRLTLTDLPGYGFAKMSKQEQADLGSMVGDYLEQRDTLVAVLLLIDIRRDVDAKDLEVRDMIAGFGRTVLPVLTKADKIGRNDQQKRIKAIAHGFGLEPEDLILAGEGLAIDQIWSRLVPLLAHTP